MKFLALSLRCIRLIELQFGEDVEMSLKRRSDVAKNVRRQQRRKLLRRQQCLAEIDLVPPKYNN